MKKMLIVDPEKCTGCETCEFVCSAVHMGVFNPYYSRIRSIRIEPTINYALGCQFCENPPCEAICPWNALERDEETGIMRLDEDKCVGCGFCVRACDFGAISMSLKDELIFICDQCEEFDDGPQCVKFCPEDAISFELLETHAQKGRIEATKRLLAEIKENIE
ncbi:MAG: 4Fe-4S dicluster domain-containing protein [Candidatus Lokiarchaeota archaeon]|nr:4Fe-4S dicluster domain-containing protein [Candidatus Lokiarchaeota archaeon]